MLEVYGSLASVCSCPELFAIHRSVLGVPARPAEGSYVAEIVALGAVELGDRVKLQDQIGILL